MSSPADSTSTESGSPERFGYSWDRFHELSADQEEQFRRWTSLIDPETGWKDKTILDVGCGTGRNSYWALTYGASEGLAIDVDDRSLSHARRKLESFPGMEVRKESVYELEIADRFDIVFSIGVIHHLENPIAALRNMAHAVKPGGKVLIWVYGYENMELYVNVLNPLRQFLFSKLPMPVIWWLAFLPTGLLWVLLRAGFGSIRYFKLIRGFSFMHLRNRPVNPLCLSALVWR